MATRDTGWIQYFAENGQQAFDLTLCAFKIGEDNRVLLPVMVNVDGFHVSHVIEPIYFIDQKAANDFLPAYKHPHALDPDNPVTMGCFAMPNFYTETRKALDNAVRESKKVVLEVWQQWAELTGRAYHPVESYKAEGMDTLLVTMGSFSENAMMAIDKMQAEGAKIGLLRIRLWRPFPDEELLKAVSGAKTLIVFDRAMSLGGPAPVCSEIKSSLYSSEKKPQIVSFVGGLGGRDVSPEQFELLINQGIEKAKAGKFDEITVFGVRE
jgi:pyruvate ferredoxin oxidoreductase alpha subunit